MTNGTENNKIYLVDDDRIVCHSLGLILRKSGYVVDVYYSAEAFLEQYEDTDTGFLVVDQCMPGLTGLELQQVLVEKNANLKVIFITAMHETVNEVALKNGAIKVFEKPFDPKGLVDLLGSQVTLYE
ncbi:MAG: response regulator [Gammaproteobacteria bacterium]|nr:response regulator [Gammaproteobacteria bacterium]